MDFNQILDIQSKLKDTYNQQIGVLNQLEKGRETKNNELSKINEKIESINIQKVLLKDASTEARKNSKDALQNMATRALQYIMGDHMSLDIIIDEKSSTPSAEFIVKSEYGDYVVDADPAEEEGGGIADIVSFSNQIAMLQLTCKRNVAPLFLDEPSKYVSAGHSESVAKFLFETSSYFERQTIMVTHDEFLAKMGDKAYHCKIENGRTVTTSL